MDPDCIPLREYLEPTATILDPFEFDKMRYKWRQWVIFNCNWKTALEAFMEPYHVAGTHTQLLEHGDYYAYSAPYGLHGVSGFDQRDPAMMMKQSSTITRAGKGADPRISTYNLQNEIYTTVNNASTTETLVKAAWRLVDAGYRIRAVPEAIVRHDFGGWRRQLRRSHLYGRARVRLYRKHPVKLRRVLRDEPMVVAYPVFILGLPLTVIFPWYPALLLIPAWRNRSNGAIRVLADHLTYGAGILRELMTR